MQTYETPEQFRDEPGEDQDERWLAEHNRLRGITLEPRDVIALEEAQGERQ